tara:strand:+ start:310 stop:519 length:210 start_codon:yes stop_codon:yes gene_type:complete
MRFTPGDIIELATDPHTGKEWPPKNDRILMVLDVEWDVVVACILNPKEFDPRLRLYITFSNQKYYKVIG